MEQDVYVTHEGWTREEKTLSVLCLVCLLFVFSCSDDETDPATRYGFFIVAFDTMGGSFIKPQLVARALSPSCRSRPEGWTFAGWYRDRKGQQLGVLDGHDQCGDNIFAKWTGGPVSGTVRHIYTLGGSGSNPIRCSVGS